MDGLSDDDWRQLAACADVPTEVFFPERDDGLGNAVAKAVCATCVVRAPCRRYAEENNIDEGVWGGEGENVRRKRRRMTKAARRRMAREDRP